MRQFAAILTVASALGAGTAARATTFLDSDAAYPVDATFLQALGVDDAGNIASVPGVGLATELADIGANWAHDPSGEGFADIYALGSSNLINQVLGIDGSGGIVGPDQPNSQTGLELQDVSGAISILDRFGSSLAQALGANKR